MAGAPGEQRGDERISDDEGPDCRRCGKPTGKWWLSDAGTAAEHRMLCASCDAADTERALKLPVRPDEEST